MDVWSDFLVIDDEIYNIKVKTGIKRNADFLDKYVERILNENETVILSTHLIEEVSNFIGRAILLQKGKIVGDISMLELDEKGEDLLSFIKKTYQYRSDRVGDAIHALELE